MSRPCPFDASEPSRSGSLARSVARTTIVAIVVGALSAGIAACGQRGPLYVPDKENPDKRR